MGPKTKWLLWCLFFISEAGLLSFLEEYIAVRNNKSSIVGFSADSLLKLNTKIDILIKFPQNEIF